MRVNVPALDKILGEKFPVLNDGFVRLVDYMGNDSSIVQAARVSYGDGTKKVSEDRNLIRYLMRHRHTTPFEMCEIKLHIRVPMDCWRQWIRHRTASVNEYSTRYSQAIDSCQETEEEAWRLQGKGNKQGSFGFVSEWPKNSGHIIAGDYGWNSPGEFLTYREHELQSLAKEIYNERLELGVAREQARKDLPLSTYTEAYWKIDLKNLLGFLALRCDSHAQQEIRMYANTILYKIVKLWVPTTYEAFNEYNTMRGGMTLTRTESHIIMALNGVSSIITPEKDAIAMAQGAGWLRRTKERKLKRNRERSECEEKLTKLGLQIPWN